MLNVGLTGGIGSGKSTIDAFLRDKGAVIIDFDTLAHRVEEPGCEAWTGIVTCFGRGVLNEDDTINRGKLGDIVFRDRDKMMQLNSIVHPAVFNEWRLTLERIQADTESAIVISDVPLLIEVKWHLYVDYILLVYISPEEQIKRIIKRNSYSRREAEERLNSQMAIDDKIPFADFVINNEGTLEETKIIVDNVWDILVQKERNQRREK
jgi:dephospho-CoA kinase